MQETKIVLSEKEIPRQWYNIIPDMPNRPMPPLHPATQKPVGPEDPDWPVGETRAFSLGLVVEVVKTNPGWIGGYRMILKPTG